MPQDKVSTGLFHAFRWAPKPEPFRQSLFELACERIRSHDNDSCLLWEGARTPFGYGKVMMPDGKIVYVHRLSFFITHGHWPKPMGLHTCEFPVPWCYSPRHIIEGTAKQNTADMFGRKRGFEFTVYRGENSPRAQLTNQQAKEAREEYRFRKVTMKQLADKFGVEENMIGKVLYGDTYKEAGGPIVTATLKRLAFADVQAMRAEYVPSWHAIMQLADKYHVSYHTAWAIINNLTRVNR